MNYKLTTYENIHFYENVIEDPYELIKNIEETDSLLNENTSITKWKKWTASDDSYDFGYQKSINPSIDNEVNKELTSINNKIKNAILTASKDYSSFHNIDIGYLTPISISKYSTGKEMGPHIDSYGDDRSPVLSVVLYLNDDYEGGNLFFPQQNINIKPSAGSIAVFPSVAPYFHQSKIVTKGIKYMSPGFWYKQLT
jgi:predicted 2-oxoglutarate/Fe(II)-dependent dioxygenase YbiX